MLKLLPILGCFALGMLLSSCVSTTGAPKTAAAQTSPVNGNIEPVTGLPKDAVVAVMGIPDLGEEVLYGVFYYPSKAPAEQLAQAPANLCSNRGLSLVSSADKALEHPSEMPGTRKLMVRCK